MNSIISYLKSRYLPLTIILYGSYADGTNNKNSDFDALLVVSEGNRHHDVSIVDGVQLDVFVYPLSDIENDIRYEALVQLLDGSVVADTDGIGHELITKVKEHWKSIPPKTAEELQEELKWCQKMLSRVKREDAEGYFRWHWLLVDSLEIVCDILRQPYRGPKKSLRWLKEHHTPLYESYNKALKEMNLEALREWVDRMAELLTG